MKQSNIIEIIGAVIMLGIIIGIIATACLTVVIALAKEKFDEPKREQKNKKA